MGILGLVLSMLQSLVSYFSWVPEFLVRHPMLAFAGCGRVLPQPFLAVSAPLLRQSLPYVVRAVIELIILLPEPPESWAYGVPSYLLCLGLGLWLGKTS